MMIKMRRISSKMIEVLTFKDCGQQPDGSWLSEFYFSDGRKIESICPQSEIVKAKDGHGARWNYDSKILEANDLDPASRSF